MGLQLQRIKLSVDGITHCHCVGCVIWDITIMARKTETVVTSETSVNIYQGTRRNIPEENHLQTTDISCLPLKTSAVTDIDKLSVNRLRSKRHVKPAFA